MKREYIVEFTSTNNASPMGLHYQVLDAMDDPSVREALAKHGIIAGRPTKYTLLAALSKIEEAKEAGA